MSRVLYIESSPRKERSSSIAIAHNVIEAYKAKNPKDEIITIDLWKKKLPPFAQDTIDAKYAIMHKEPHTEAQKRAWSEVESIINEFKQADKYILSTPMWNFGIPYILKHYIDLITQPGYAFRVTSTGAYEGLITGKPIIVVYSRGGAYGPGTGGEAFDLQTTYMKALLTFIGFTDIRPIIIEPTLAGEEKKTEALRKAKNEIGKVLVGF